MWQELIAIAGGGALGACLRFLMAQAVQRIAPSNFPWGILLVNILGSFLIGFLAVWLLQRGGFSAVSRAAIIIGFLGGFTTFSSFSLDTVTLLKAGEYAGALWNIGLSVVLCLLATGCGGFLAKSII